MLINIVIFIEIAVVAMVYVYAQVNGTKKWRKKDKNSPPLILVTQYCVMEVDRGGGSHFFYF